MDRDARAASDEAPPRGLGAAEATRLPRGGRPEDPHGVGLPRRAPRRVERPRLHAYEPWYKIGAGLMAEARPALVAYNLRTPEVTTAMVDSLVDVWNAKVSPATGADQTTQVMQAILDQTR